MNNLLLDLRRKRFAVSSFPARGFLAQRADPHHHHHQIMSLCSSSQCCFSSSSHFLVLEQRFSVCSETRPEFFCLVLRQDLWDDDASERSFLCVPASDHLLRKKKKNSLFSSWQHLQGSIELEWTVTFAHKGTRDTLPTATVSPPQFREIFSLAGLTSRGSHDYKLYSRCFTLSSERNQAICLFFFFSSLYVQIPMHTQSPPSVSVSILLVCDTYGRTTTADPGTFFFVNDWWCEYSSLRFEDLFVFCVVLSCFCMRFSTEVCDL